MSRGSSAHEDSAPSERPPNRTLWSRLVVVAGVAVVVVVAAVVVGLRSHDGDVDSAGGAVTSTTTRSADTTPVAAVWNIPQAFLGTWQGVAEDGQRAFDVELIIKPGKNSEELVQSSHIDKASGGRCDSIDRVITVDETELTLAARRTAGTDCPDGTTSTIHLRPDGTIAYTAASRTGGLHKA
ncbi:hypothetical protein ACIA8C_30835 [Nocardia sp. NPDC051321]|uniref:hypothetical protein n=1 Tax=Nocardia sp. NPDC051321 TaxID=3364323 RepID=UPI0037AEC5D5